MANEREFSFPSSATTEALFLIHDRMNREVPFQCAQELKRFVFSDKADSEEKFSVEVLIPEVRKQVFLVGFRNIKEWESFALSSSLICHPGLKQLQASYSFYTWPCASYLAWYLFENRRDLDGKHIVELGAGTSLPSVLAAKCGAKVTITDSAHLPKTLQNIHHICQTNKLDPEKYQVLGITWGSFFNQIFELGEVDLIIASDCFYEPLLFEDILVTVAFLLNCHPQSTFICAYQERSADWTIEHLLNKWSLCCRHIDLSVLGCRSVLNTEHIIQDHTIHLLEITKQ